MSDDTKLLIAILLFVLFLVGLSLITLFHLSDLVKDLIRQIPIPKGTR